MRFALLILSVCLIAGCTPTDGEPKTPVHGTTSITIKALVTYRQTLMPKIDFNAKIGDNDATSMSCWTNWRKANCGAVINNSAKHGDKVTITVTLHDCWHYFFCHEVEIPYTVGNEPPSDTFDINNTMVTITPTFNPINTNPS